MTTPRRFSVPNEKRKIFRMYLDLRTVLESVLTNMKASPEELSAARLDVAFKSLKALPAILSELDRMQQEEKRKEQLEKEREDAMANLPTKQNAEGQSSAFSEAPNPVAAVEPISLPFPLTSIGVQGGK